MADVYHGPRRNAPAAKAKHEGASAAPEPEAKPRRRWPGCLAWALATGVLLALALPYLIPTTALRKALAARIGQATGRECAIGSLSFGWFEGARVEGFRLGAEADPFRLEVGKATVDASLLPLLRRRVANLDVRATGARARYSNPETGLDLDWTVPVFLLTAAALDDVASFRIEARPGAPGATGRVKAEGTTTIFRSMAFHPGGRTSARLTFESLDLTTVMGPMDLAAGGALSGGLGVEVQDGLAVLTADGLVAEGLRPLSGGSSFRGLPASVAADAGARFEVDLKQLSIDEAVTNLRDGAAFFFGGAAGARHGNGW